MAGLFGVLAKQPSHLNQGEIAQGEPVEVARSEGLFVALGFGPAQLVGGEAWERKLHGKPVAIDEPVADGEFHGAHGVAEVCGQRGPFLEGEVIEDVEAERGDPDFRSDGGQIVHIACGWKAGPPGRRGGLSKSAWRATAED